MHNCEFSDVETGTPLAKVLRDIIEHHDPLRGQAWPTKAEKIGPCIVLGAFTAVFMETFKEAKTMCGKCGSSEF